MTLPRQVHWLTVLCLGAAALAALAEDQPVFDRGEKYDAEHGIKYKLRDEKKDKKKDDGKTLKAVRYHVKGLKDADPEVRQSSCEMLAVLGSPEAVEPLIDVLRPERKEPVMVLLTAHGALRKLTGKNFGYKAYDEWFGWWMKNKDEFMKQAEMGVDEKSKIAAESANTIGLELMRRGEFHAAQAQFLDAVNRNPTVPDYINNLGRALLEQGRGIDAIEYFQEVIGLDPALPQPYMNIGRCYSRMERSIEASSWYKKAAERDKDGKLWDLFWMIGREHMKRAEWTLAFEYLDQARVKSEKRAPPIHEPLLYKDLAITHYGLDQYHSAWKELMNVRACGYEPDGGLLEKVRKALKELGVDPDEEDRKAREVLRDQDAENGDNAEKERAPKP
jgi:tetratricopeptide (TPR) repeat protein